MKRSSFVFMVIRALGALFIAYHFATRPGTMLWVKICFVALIIAPIIVDAIRTCRFYQQNIRNGPKYN